MQFTAQTGKRRCIVYLPLDERGSQTRAERVLRSALQRKERRELVSMHRKKKLCVYFFFMRPKGRACCDPSTSVSLPSPIAWHRSRLSSIQFCLQTPKRNLLVVPSLPLPSSSVSMSVSVAQWLSSSVAHKFNQSTNINNCSLFPRK